MGVSFLVLSLVLLLVVFLSLSARDIRAKASPKVSQGCLTCECVVSLVGGVAGGERLGSLRLLFKELPPGLKTYGAL